MTDKWGRFSPDEIERRRLHSASLLRQRQKDEFDQWYQEKCDTFYWSNGPCCAGCDHWSSGKGNLGECMSSPPVSGMEVFRSMGVSFCSLPPELGQPLTSRDHLCGAFQDKFDWSTLPDEYLERIGAKK